MNKKFIPGLIPGNEKLHGRIRAQLFNTARVEGKGSGEKVWKEFSLLLNPGSRKMVQE